MAWVQVEVVGRVLKSGRIHAEGVGQTLIEGPRPANFEQSGADRSVYERLRDRERGFKFRTRGFVGGAVAWLLQVQNLLLWPRTKLLDARLKELNGGRQLPKWMLLGLMRTAGAPTIYSVLEPAGGMSAVIRPLLFELFKEGLELLVYNDDGWLGYRLPSEYRTPPEYTGFQDQLREKQISYAGVALPDKPRIGEVDIECLPYGKDTFNGVPGIICPCMTAGEWSFVVPATLRLEGTGWKLMDTEWRKGKPELGEPEHVPFHRKVCGFTRRMGEDPMLWEFDRRGGLDDGPHFPLVPALVPKVISHLMGPTLGEWGLNWLRETA